MQGSNSLSLHPQVKSPAWRLRHGIVVLLAILFVLTGAQVSGLGYVQTGRLSVPEAHAATNLTCTAGSFYTLTAGDRGNSNVNSRYARIYAATANSSSGTINAAVNAVGQPTTGNTWGWLPSYPVAPDYYYQFNNGSSYSWGINGLAVGASGGVAYAFDRFAYVNSHTNQDANLTSYVAILKYDPSSGTNGTYSTALSSYQLPYGSTPYMVAGAVNPVNGKYYFGGYGGSPANRFFLYVYDPSTNAVSQVGYYDVTQVNGQGGNGDIVFDADGNMSMIYSPLSSSVNNRIITFASQTIASGSGNNALSAAVDVALTATTTPSINGIAYDTSGYLYVQASGQVARYDPNTGAASGWTTLTGFSGNSSTSDLGSCLTPGTLMVQKVVNGRVASGDQFTMNVVRTDAPSTNLATATTTGSATGLQSVTPPPVIGVVGKSYTVSESAFGTTDLSKYSSSYSCTWTDSNGQVQSNSGSGTTLQLSFPAAGSGAAKGVNVMCTFTNTPKPTVGNVYWNKRDSGSWALLGGSTWTLTGATGNAVPVPANTVVSDCVSSPCDTGTYKDQNSAAGQFALALPFGTYTLTEMSAPTSSAPPYVIDSGNTYTFTVGTTNVNYDFVDTRTATVTINKIVQDVNGLNPGPGSGWNVSTTLVSATSSTTAGTTILPGGAQTTGSSGAAPNPWSVTFPNGAYPNSPKAAVTVSETQETGYTSVSATCVVTHAGGTTANVDLGGVSGTISNITPGDSVACTFVNKPIAGTVTWHKVDAASTSTFLASSGWTYWPVAAGTTTCPDTVGPGSITVIDNGNGDTNSADGKFAIGGLAWGSYCLKETTAPAGFALAPSGTSQLFTISADHLNQDFTSDTDAPFADVRQTVPTLPLTGGMSADAFLLAGAGFLALACAFGIVVALRRRGSARRH